jgi:hypothetical protein
MENRVQVAGPTGLSDPHQKSILWKSVEAARSVSGGPRPKARACPGHDEMPDAQA